MAKVFKTAALMLLSDFHYHLPKELIAAYPLPERSASRLLCLDRATSKIAHRKIVELPDLLLPGDLLVFNNTRVIPARIFARKTTGGKIEILVEKILTDHSFLAHAKPGKSLKTGMQILLPENQTLHVIARDDDLWRFEIKSSQKILDILYKIGHIPLPPYIKRTDETLDKERYQTVFAQQEGAVAAPTAGLHFDENLLQQLKNKNIEIAFITLHVGAGTFKPVKVVNFLEHKMHKEYFAVAAETCNKIARCKKNGGRVIAVGTTVVRSLETIAQRRNLMPYAGETDIFIYPGYQFRCIDGMITNFHLPESTLLMLVCAFGGYNAVMNAYREAIWQQYRFFSYGDAMLIL